MSKDWWLFRQVLCPFSSWKYNTSSLTPVLACHRLADLHQLNYSQDTFSHKCAFWTTLECQVEHRQRNALHWSCRRCFDRGATCVCVLYAGSCYVGAAIRDWAEFAGRWTRGLLSPHRASADPARRTELLVEAVEQDTNLETVQQLGGRRQSPHCETTRYRYSARQPAHWACQKCQNCCETKPENGAYLIHHAGALIRRTANHVLLRLCKVGTCLADFWDTLGTSRVGEWIAGSFCKNSACTLLSAGERAAAPGTELGQAADTELCPP